MSSWLFRSLVVLYPKAWRERYSKEVGDLSAELLEAGETTRLHLALGLAMSALAERVRSLHRARFVAVLLGSAALVVVLVVMAVSLFAGNGPKTTPGFIMTVKEETVARALAAAADKAEAAAMTVEMSPARACTASQLTVGFFGSGVGNPGQGITEVRITDASTVPCSLKGYPAVTFLSNVGVPMRVTVGRLPIIYGALATVVLPPGKAASAGFIVASYDFPAEGTACPTAASIRVRLPDIPQPFTVTAPVRLCRLLAGISPIVKGAELAPAL
jgi:hypothetical protein